MEFGSGSYPWYSSGLLSLFKKPIDVSFQLGTSLPWPMFSQYPIYREKAGIRSENVVAVL